MNPLLNDIIALLTSHKLTIATCESVTGGMIASNLVSVDGASKVFLGGFVTYTNESKTKLVNVDRATLNKHGAISNQVASLMAKNTITKFHSDIAIGITGNAGPVAQEKKPVGQAYLAIVIIDQVYLYELQAEAKTRNEIRIEFTFQALNKLLKLLKGMDK
ncbi:MAG: CinA family protein [Mycoplasmataceae bacterium]|jgi:PncC family amidohydrolase|nr:CinA family protein [Mycoplasmataceae bacterium]